MYCEVGAFGHVGPLREEPGYDPLMQAFSGIMSLTGDADRPPSRAGVSIIDLGTGTWAALGIITALLRRNLQGTGATVNRSLFETSLAWMALSLGTAAAGGQQGERFGSGIGFIAPSQAYMTADGYLMLSCANDALFAKLCEGLGHRGSRKCCATSRCGRWAFWASHRTRSSKPCTAPCFHRGQRGWPGDRFGPVEIRFRKLRLGLRGLCV